MSNAAAQLVVDPLFWRGVLFFFRGIREDVLKDLFSPEDFFREQVKAGENSKGVNHVIANESKKRIERKLTLEWYASLVECFPL
jgi:hypothetical protein